MKCHLQNKWLGPEEASGYSQNKERRPENAVQQTSFDHLSH